MHEGDGCVWYRIAVAAVLVPVNRLVRHEWRHAERLPRAGGAIVAANHISNADPLVLAWFVRRLRRGEGWHPTVAFSVGEPVDLSAFRGRPLTASVLREAAEVVMEAVCRQVVAVRGGTPPTVPFDPRPLRVVPAAAGRRA